jgi:hypothetical protein
MLIHFVYHAWFVGLKEDFFAVQIWKLLAIFTVIYNSGRQILKITLKINLE